MPDVSDFCTTDNGSFLTIADGYHRFTGTITLSASMVGVTGTGTVQYPSVTVEGDPLYYSAGDKLAMVAVGSPTVNLLSLLATSDSNSVTIPIAVQSNASGTGGCHLKLHFNGATGVAAIAVGSTT